MTALIPATSYPARSQAGSRSIYLDANATTRPLPEVVDLVAAVMRDFYANPSSAHWLGGDARMVLERARDGIAALFSGTFPESGCREGTGTDSL